MAQKRKPIKIKESMKGTFTLWCKRHGYGGVNSSCVAAGKRSDDPRIVKKAVFAQNFALRRKKKKQMTVSIWKAGEILRHGKIRGKSLSEKQKRFFGFLRGGGTPAKLKLKRKRKKT